MVEECPICKVFSLENGICNCCGYIVRGRNAVNVISALKPNEYSVSMRYQQGQVICTCTNIKIKEYNHD